MGTFLFNSACLQILKSTVNFANFLRVLPIRWNERTLSIDFVTISRNPCGRYFVVYILLAHCIQLIFNIVHDVHSLTITKIKYLPIAITTFGAVTLTLVVIFSFEFASNGHDLILACNRALKYYASVQGKFLKTNTKRIMSLCSVL